VPASTPVADKAAARTTHPDAAAARPPPEPLARVLARNLVVARNLVGMTQHELAARSGVSRATVAQVESGAGDPRLSTLRDLAGAMGISPIVLLAGTREVQALAALPREVADRPVPVADQDLARMREFSASLLHRDWSRGARIGAGIARSAGCRTPGGAATAGLFSVSSPGWGTVVGTALGRLME
jgi:transcriptional regulator with XRE-family HTH domain